MQTSSHRSGLQRWLSDAPNWLFSIYVITAAFGTYFCMYAFRKPFTAAEYDGAAWLGVGLKTIYITSQVTGYTLSKFIGIKVISEMPARYRALSLLVLIAFAELSLLLFAVTPPPWNFVWLFTNGLPLGMVFGLVLGFLEGRRITEALTAGLCASFIVSSGFVKSVGRSLISDYHVDSYWMPFWTGLLFVIPLLIFVGMLTQIPPPSPEDEDLRTRRSVMNRDQRRRFRKRHTFGLIGLLSIYVLLTVVRNIRDDFAVEIWNELGVGDEPTVFVRSEFWVMIAVMMINGSAFLIRDNRVAFLTSLAMMMGGFTIALSSVAAYGTGNATPMVLMVLMGVGFYIPYVAFHTTVFERMIAVFRETGTVGYLMYLADAVGYLAYIGVMVFRNLAGESSASDISFLRLLLWSASLISIFSAGILVVLLFHYWRRLPNKASG